jgi:hypothetical protein
MIQITISQQYFLSTKLERFLKATLFLLILYTFIPPKRISIKNSAKNPSINTKSPFNAKVTIKEKVITLKNR